MGLLGTTFHTKCKSSLQVQHKKKWHLLYNFFFITKYHKSLNDFNIMIYSFQRYRFSMAQHVPRTQSTPPGAVRIPVHRKQSKRNNLINTFIHCLYHPIVYPGSLPSLRQSIWDGHLWVYNGMIQTNLFQPGCLQISSGEKGEKGQKA